MTKLCTLFYTYTPKPFAVIKGDPQEFLTWAWGGSHAQKLDHQHYTCAGEYFRAVYQDGDVEHWFKRKNGEWGYGKNGHAKYIRPSEVKHRIAQSWITICEERARERHRKDEAFLRGWRQFRD